MVSPLFTALALIACGRAEVPPAPTQPVVISRISGPVRDEDAEAGRLRRRR